MADRRILDPMHITSTTTAPWLNRLSRSAESTRAERSLTFARSALIALALVAGGVAHAQSTPPAAEDETVVLDAYTVTGIRANLLKSEEAKREMPQVVDSINAEDIGKFPDRSLAEALQRIPGVQISRNRGEATLVLIRGLPDLATTINGDEVFTGNGRRLSMQDVPTEALASIEVYKSSTPNQLEGGIAGLMNVALRTPFDFPGRTASVYTNVRRTDPDGNSAPSTNDANFGALVSNRWKTRSGEVGLLFDVVFNQDRYNNPVQWVDLPDRIWAVDAQGNGRRLEDNEIGADGKYAAPAGTRLGSLPAVGGVYSAGKRQRPMFHTALKLKTSDTLQFDAHAMYTGYRARWEEDFLFSVTQWAPVGTGITLAPDGPWTDTPLGKINPVLTATLPPIPNGVDPFTAASTQAHESRTDTVYSSLGMTWNSANLTWNSVLSYVTSLFEDDRIIVDQNVPYPTTTIATNVDGHGTFRVTTPGSQNPLRDPRQYQLRGLFQSWDEAEGTQVAWRNDFTYNLSNGFLRSLKGGLRYSSHNATNHSADGGRDVPDPANRPIPDSVFGPTFTTIVPGVDRLGGPFATPSSAFLLDYRDTVRTWYGAPAGRLPENPNRLFDQDEERTALYLMANYRFDVGSVEVDGSAGVRAIRTERTLRGKNSIGSVVEPFTLKSENDDVLPSANAVIKWMPGLQSHVGVGKTITRPTFGELNPSLSATPPTINRDGFGSAGNPNLKPIESTNIDVTLEYYFKNNGYVSVAGFHREIDGYLQTFTEFENRPDGRYSISRPNNSGKGELKGWEISGQKFFDFMPAPFSDFGVMANYTYIDGENQTATTLNGTQFVTTDLTNVAKRSYNIALMYEAHGFSARLALTHRGDYAEALRTGRFLFDNRVQASDYIDLSVGYRLTEQMTLQFNIENLTNENYASYQGHTLRPRDIRYGSRVFVVGLRWKM